MLKMRLFKTFFISLILIAVIHYLATMYALYVLIPSLDTAVHTLGGFIVGLATISLFEQIEGKKRIFNKQAILFCLVVLMGLFVGAAWEIFENLVGLTSYLDKVDTITDLVADTVGGIIAYAIYRFIIW